MEESKVHFQQERILAGWKATNKWPSALPLCVVPSCPHSLPSLILTSKRGLKWTESGLSKSPYTWGEVVRDCCPSRYKNGTGRKNSSGHTPCICVLQVIPHWPICWLKGSAVVKASRFLLVGLILLLFSLKAFAQMESTSCNKQSAFSLNWWCSFIIY